MEGCLTRLVPVNINPPDMASSVISASDSVPVYLAGWA